MGQLGQPLPAHQLLTAMAASLTLVGEHMALFALIDDVALGQPILPAAVQAARAVLTDDPGDGSLVQDIGRCALGVWRRVSPAGSGQGLHPPPQLARHDQDVCTCAFQIHTGTHVYITAYVFIHMRLQKGRQRDFPGGPAVRTPCFHCRHPGSIPGRGTKILQAAVWPREERKNGGGRALQNTTTRNRHQRC